MNDLLKQLDEYTAEGCDWNNTDWLIKASYRYANVPEPSQLHCLAYSLAKQIERLEARIAELEKPYVPISNAEIGYLYAGLNLENINEDRFYVERSIEAEVINRYNEQRAVK